jgi:hypothetical protein
MIPYHFYVSPFLLSETETWYRNMWNISDRCFRSKHKTETDPEISFILPRCQCWYNQGFISFRRIWNAFQYNVSKNRIMIRCLKKK